eukprot:TRINITY_DN13978_c0_g1_i2.p1 TRINITY_DN13978_c0_g1~~TRINITY_DN13978_c0_g1_i2.p1  ORF type:complete len:135 (-),score=25.89 TRINITY_DN13978_c0_g1_i2:83-487(-)
MHVNQVNKFTLDSAPHVIYKKTLALNSLKFKELYINKSQLSSLPNQTLQKQKYFNTIANPCGGNNNSGKSAMAKQILKRQSTQIDQDELVKIKEEINEISYKACLLYTSDAADDMQCVDLGGRRIIKKKKRQEC